MHRRSSYPRPVAAVPRSIDPFDVPGVFVAPWVGPNDEIVLIALDGYRRLLGEPMTIPNGADHVAASDKMLERLKGAERPIKLI